MTPAAKNSASMAREREVRSTAYLIALAERDASGPDDARTEARLNLALGAMERWGDSIPGAQPSTSFESPAPEVRVTPVAHPGAVDTVEATAARILASDSVAPEEPNARKPSAAAETVDAIVARILES